MLYIMTAVAFGIVYLFIEALLVSTAPVAALSNKRLWLTSLSVSGFSSVSLCVSTIVR